MDNLRVDIVSNLVAGIVINSLHSIVVVVRRVVNIIFGVSYIGGLVTKVVVNSVPIIASVLVDRSIIEIGAIANVNDISLNGTRRLVDIFDIRLGRLRLATRTRLISVISDHSATRRYA